MALLHALQRLAFQCHLGLAIANFLFDAQRFSARRIVEDGHHARVRRRGLADGQRDHIGCRGKARVEDEDTALQVKIVRARFVGAGGKREGNQAQDGGEAGHGPSNAGLRPMGKGWTA